MWKLKKIMRILSKLPNLFSKQYNFAQKDSSKIATMPSAQEKKHQKIFFLDFRMHETGSSQTETRQHTEHEKKRWAKGKEVYSKQHRRYNCGRRDTTWWRIVKVYKICADPYIFCRHRGETSFSKDCLFGSEKARKAFRKYWKYFGSSNGESSLSFYYRLHAVFT